ncbi:MAG: hypothetical protein Q8N53_18260 [Longimicrobiales bacterium]|nr:hypothetical protein [Longimicrobiales bacterium]
MLWLMGRPPVAVVPGPLRPLPFDPGVLVGRAPDGAPAPLSLRGGAVVLYVDDQCPFCVREMGAWHRESGGAVPARLRIVRGPAGGAPHPGIVPASWAHAAMLDHDGSIGAALGVGAVPFLAVTDSRGWVVEASVGLTPPGRIRTLLQSFTTNPQGVVHE